MRTLIVLSLVAIACADKLGYNYQPVAHSSAGLSFQPGSAASAPSYSAPAASSYLAPAASSHPVPGGSSYSAPAGSSFSAPLQSAAAPAVVEYEKEFFTFSGPEQTDDSAAFRQQLESSLKKHLRVIFIKNPEDSGIENAALSLAQHAAEQKTAIYVLNKETDLADLANKLNNAGNSNNLKPEVHFVKYRTQEDATHAQQAIQAQYDQLGGSSLSHNGGVAPLLNFASPAAAVRAAEPQSPTNSYLPASVFF